MTADVLIAIITTGGALLTAVIVETIRRERAQKRTDQTLEAEILRHQQAQARTDEAIEAVLGQMSPNGGSSMHDAVREIRADVRDIKRTQTTHGERLAAVEARVSDHLNRSRPNVP